MLALYWRNIGVILALYWRNIGVVLALYWRSVLERRESFHEGFLSEAQSCVIGLIWKDVTAFATSMQNSDL